MGALRGFLLFFAETGSEGGYWAFQDARYLAPDLSWLNEGLHLLKDGDYLTIYSLADPTQVVWEGRILLRQYPPFKEDASGFWIHSDQEGVERERWARWFFDKHPAELVLGSSQVPEDKNGKEGKMQERHREGFYLSLKEDWELSDEELALLKTLEFEPLAVAAYQVRELFPFDTLAQDIRRPKIALNDRSILEKMLSGEIEEVLDFLGQMREGVYP